MLKRFPRLTTVALSYVAAFLVFGFLGAAFFHGLLAPLGIAGVFIAGALYTFSFTASIGALLLVALAPYYPAGVIAVVGGLGAFAADLTIFSYVRHDLKKEVALLARSALAYRVGSKSIFCKRWFRNALGAFILASPLPDELGVAMMSLSKMSKETFAFVSFIVDAIGIYALVAAASLLY